MRQSAKLVAVTLTRTQVVELLDRHGLVLSRALGQNFVVDPNTVERVARLADVGPGDHVVEIGAGVGSLTLPLAATGAAVTAVEIDRRVAAALREVVEPEGVTVVEGDALRARLGRACSAPAPAGCSSPTSPTTWRRRCCATCSTTCPASGGCW